MPGRTVGGRYRIVERIGRGGHGEVYRAQQLPLGREVALKVLLPEAYTGDTPERFAREASLVQTLDHPNTVRLYDFGVDEAGLPYMAFELLRGRTLEEEIAKGPLDPARVARIGSQVLKALMDAHARGIVHRDVKPSNVFLVDFAGEPDFVKVLDFGVARRTVESTTQPKITSDGQIVGTPSYMAPEQVTGGVIGPATDLYSLGLVLAEALSGETVVDGKSEAEIWMKQASPAPVTLPSRVLTTAFGPIVLRATNKELALRYGSAEEMLRAVEHAMRAGSATTDEMVGVPPTVPAPRPSPTAVMAPPRPVVVPRPSSWAKWAIGLLALAGALAIFSAVRPYVFRGPQRTSGPQRPLVPRNEAPAPPMIPVEARLAPAGWTLDIPVRVQNEAFFSASTFVLVKPKNPRLIVVVIDYISEELAISDEESRRKSMFVYVVHRRGTRLVAINDNEKGETAREVAPQLLP